MAFDPIQILISAKDEASGAFARVRDAVSVVTDAIKAKLDVESSEIIVQRKKLEAAQAEQQALLKVAQARGDELAAVKARDALRNLEVQKLGLLVQAKTAEAEAMRRTTAALRDEMSMAGPLTQQQQQRLRVAENAERALLEEAHAAKRAADGIQQLAAAEAAAVSKARSMASAQEAVADSTKSISEQLRLLQSLYLSIQGIQGTAAMAKDLAATADAVNNLQSRLKIVTGEGKAFEQAWLGVQEVSLRTHSALEETGTLFTRIAQAGMDAGLSVQKASDQSLRLTETINQAVQLSGASAEASSAAITQLIQGLQSGVLRGEEFNSVMEQAPRLARALADGLGVTTGELRKLAEAGTLTSDTVIKALKAQSDTVAGEFQKLPPTVGRALQDLSTKWSLYVAEVDKSTGASVTAAQAITALGNNLNALGSLLGDLGQGFAAFLALGVAQHFYGLATASAKAAVEMRTMGAVSAATAVQVEKASAAARGFGAALNGIKAFALLTIITNFKDIGTWIGEATAKLMGYRDRTEELAAAERLAAAAAAESAAQRERMAQQLQETLDRQQALSRAAATAVGEFDRLTKSGSTAAEAIKKITDGFDLSKVDGIKDFTATLEQLAATGKAAAKDVQDAWANALKGEDLGAWEVRVRQAFAFAEQDAQRAAKAVEDALARGITGKPLEDLRQKAQLAAAEVAKAGERMQSALDAGVREAVRRTGLDWDALSGKIGAASRSAINDVQAIQDGLKTMKSEGVDTGRVLTASLSKAIQTADGQAAIDALKGKVNELRNELGDKVADGLLEQAAKRADELKDALDEATPGINSAREAFKALGIETDAALKDKAKTAREAYDAIKNSGTASAREINEAWKTMAEASIKANDGVADSTIKSEAAARGFAIETDAAGKSVVKSLGAAKGAAKGVGDALGEAGEEGRDALGKIDYGAKMAGKSLEELEKISRKNWDAQRDLSDQAAESNAAANESVNAWAKQQQEQNKYYGEMVKILQKTRMGYAELNKAAWAGANALEELDKQQKAIEQSSGGAAQELEAMRDKLAELDGDEETMGRRRAERDKAEVLRKQALMQLDLQRAQIRKDNDEVARLNAELAAYQEQLALIDQIAAKEAQARQRKANEERKAEREREKQAAEAARKERDENASTQQERIDGIAQEGAARDDERERQASEDRKQLEDAMRERQAAEDDALRKKRAAEDKAAQERYNKARKALEDEEALRQDALRRESDQRAEQRRQEDERVRLAEAARVAREKADRDAAAKAAEAAEKQRADREAKAKPGSRTAEEEAALARQRDAVLAAQKQQAEEQARLDAERAEAAAQARAKRLQEERSAEDKAAAERERLATEAHQARLRELEEAERKRQERVQEDRAKEDERLAAQREREAAILKAMQDVAAGVLAIVQARTPLGGATPGIPGVPAGQGGLLGGRDAAGVGSGGGSGVSRTVSVNLAFEGRNLGMVDTSPGGADVLQRLFSQLERGRRSAA